MRLTVLHLFAAAFLLGGCAVHPVPEDVTKIDTYHIVQKIRCEVRDSLRAYLIEAIAEVQPDIARSLREGKLDYATFNRNRLHQKVEDLLARYDQTAIAYEFEFDMSETNAASGGIGLGSILPNGSTEINARGGSDRSRRNSRNFRIVDTFEKLVRLLDDETCREIESGESWAYPISGTLGMKELVGTFLRLNQKANLSGADYVPTLSETLEFTTSFDGSVEGTLKLELAGSSLRLSDASLSAKARRADSHKLTIVFTLPPEDGAAAEPKTIAERRAFEELARQRNLEIDDETLKLRRQLVDIVQ